MHTYKELYFLLFNVLTDAIRDLEEGRILQAADRMQRAQLAAEEAHMEQDILAEE